jgi:RNA polymerase primary sigma factor
MVERINRVGAARRRLLQREGRDPAPAEIGRELEMSPEDVEELLKLGQETVSLETPVGAESGDAVLGDLIPDTDLEGPIQVVANRLRDADVQRVLMTLGWRERRVIELRYGLSGDAPQTLEQIGEEVGVTRERVRQIEAKTLAKLKYTEQAKRLHGAAEDIA